MIHPAKAITALRPGAHWHMVGDTLDGLVWEDEEQTAPTQEEVDAKLIELEAEVEAQKIVKEEAYQSALTKLSALGLTEEEVQAIIK
jgi:DNA-dependent RNA polymerase auxiliary subunit epsilon